MDSEHRRSVEKVYESMERTPGFPKWREECLFLLVENFIALDDPFQAEYTLDFIEENTLGEGKVERITELRDRLKEKQEEANEQSASEAEEEAFKSLYLNDLPSIELPEEEGEELSIGPGKTGEEEEEEEEEASLEEELTKEANNDEDDDEQN